MTATQRVADPVAAPRSPFVKSIVFHDFTLYCISDNPARQEDNMPDLRCKKIANVVSKRQCVLQILLIQPSIHFEEDDHINPWLIRIDRIETTWVVFLESQELSAGRQLSRVHEGLDQGESRPNLLRCRLDFSNRRKDTVVVRSQEKVHTTRASVRCRLSVFSARKSRAEGKDLVVNELKFVTVNLNQLVFTQCLDNIVCEGGFCSHPTFAGGVKRFWDIGVEFRMPNTSAKQFGKEHCSFGTVTLIEQFAEAQELCWLRPVQFAK